MYLPISNLRYLIVHLKYNSQSSAARGRNARRDHVGQTEPCLVDHRLHQLLT